MRFLIVFLLLVSTVYAEDVGTYSGTVLTGCRSIGDTNVFLTNPDNYATIKPGFVYLPDGCKSLPAVEQKYIKYDASVIVGVPFVEMTTSEKAIVDAQLQAAQDAAILTRRQQLGMVMANSNTADFSLTQIDNAIDNINNLNEAKAFLKKLVRGMIKLTEGNQ